MRGDALVAEFARASDAVLAALSFQKANAEHNRALSDDIQPELRIGISLGEVVVADGTLTGPDVVLAQRLEQMASPGRVCLSAAVQQAVPARLPIDYEELGEQSFKGFPKPVRTYTVALRAGETVPEPEPRPPPGQRTTRWSGRSIAGGSIALALAAVGMMAWWQPWAPREEPALPENMAFPLPDKPSIAVLPFDNLSEDPERERMVDGLTEDIITDLARFPDVFVIARNSTFTYKGRAVKIQQVAEDLGVRYVLEGSMQIDGGRARVTAQLIDALTGHHVWAERYERPLDDVFALQDEVTKAIVATIAGYSGKIASAEREIVRRKPPESLSAYELYLLGAEHKHRFTEEDNAKAQEYLFKAIDLDPNFARAYVVLAWSYVQELEQGWGRSLAESKEKFREATLKAVQLDNTDAEAQLQLAMIYSFDHDTAGAERATRRAIELGPNNATALILAGWNLLYIADPSEAAEAVELIERAIRLNPDTPDWYAYGLGISQYFASQFEDSIATLKRARPATFQSRLYLAASYAQLGRDEEATQLVQSLLQENPAFSAREYAAAIGIIDERALAHFVEGLREAGLPE